jgi:hypothetical protein
MMHNNNEDPLSILNNNANYELSNTLLLALGENSESNPYIDNKLNTLYHDQDLPPPSTTSSNNISFLSLNVRSLMSNYPRLNSIISRYMAMNSNIKAIALQEIWAVPYPELVQMDGFTLVCKTRGTGRGGALAFISVATSNIK